MENDDFLNAFAGMNILKTEASAEIIGRAIGKTYLGMIAVGVKEDDARQIIRSAFAEVCKAFITASLRSSS